MIHVRKTADEKDLVIQVRTKQRTCFGSASNAGGDVRPLGLSRHGARRPVGLADLTVRGSWKDPLLAGPTRRARTPGPQSAPAREAPRLSLAGPVVGARCQKPDPISNSAVKLLSADGTVSQDPGE